MLLDKTKGQSSVMATNEDKPNVTSSVSCISNLPGRFNICWWPKDRVYDIATTNADVSGLDVNGPFPSCCEPRYESEAKREVFPMKISFVCI